MAPSDHSLQEALTRATEAQQELDKRVFHLKTLYETACELSGLNQPRQMMETFLLAAMGIFGITQGLVILINTRTHQGHLAHRGLPKVEVETCERNLACIVEHYMPREGRLAAAPTAELIKSGESADPDLLPASTELLVKRMVDETYAVIVALGRGFAGQPPAEADVDTLLSLTGVLTSALAQTLFQRRIQHLDADLVRQNTALEDALRQVGLARGNLDRQIFYLQTLYELTAELSPIVNTESLMENFLLITMGTFGLAQGAVLLCDRENRSVRSVNRGPTFNAGLSFEAAEKMLFQGFQHAEERRLGPMSVTLITNPERVFSPSETGFPVNTALLFTVDSSLLGLVGLGMTLGQTDLDPDERKLLHGLAANFMVFLKNARAFETIQALNENLRRTNADLRQTIAELTDARQQIRLLELAKTRLKQLVQREIERVGRFRVSDVLMIIFVATLLSLPFNYASPNGIKILPGSLFLKAPPSIDASSVRQLVAKGEAVVVDARPPELFAQKHIAEAVNIPAALFEIIFPMKLAHALKPEQLIVVYGRTISKRYDDEVAHRLLQRYDSVKVLEGGLAAWERKGYPVKP
ncbi:MAG: rhodanese-like domain-containing protein [Desulfobacterales bacterium]|nr:MAG: rhodanese-like domain-containing protein [Desulfobacterales bacterium]